MAEVGTRLALTLLSRLMSGEQLSVPGLLQEDSEWTDATVRRVLGMLEECVPNIIRQAGRPANWVYQGVQAFRFCPHCGKTLPYSG